MTAIWEWEQGWPLLIEGSAYTVFAIPLAAGVLYPAFTLSPAMGAVLMSLSTVVVVVVVVVNAQLLRRKIK